MICCAFFYPSLFYHLSVYFSHCIFFLFRWLKFKFNSLCSILSAKYMGWHGCTTTGRYLTDDKTPFANLALELRVIYIDVSLLSLVVDIYICVECYWERLWAASSLGCPLSSDSLFDNWTHRPLGGWSYRFAAVRPSFVRPSVRLLPAFLGN